MAVFLQQWSRILGEILWGPVMVALIVGVGVRFALGTGWMQLRHGGQILRSTVGSLFTPTGARGGVTPFGAMTAALAGTMGTGNVAGIATAIVAGGPGAVFWMWVSAFFGMMTKYGEVVLAVHYREAAPAGGWQGGPMTYIRRGLKMPWLAAAFSFFCVLASFGVGNAAQVNSMAAALEAQFHLPAILVGVAAAIAVALVTVGGIGRISSFTQAVIPLMSLLYLCCGSVVLWQNREQLPQAAAMIFQCAFAPRAALGGAGGYTVAQAVRLGVSRGVFTNEAGLGSAPIAHASAGTDSPVEQGMWGIVEVFADTMLICTFTALVILSSGTLWQSGLDGAALTAAAFRQGLGRWGSAVVALSMVSFALAAIIGWAYYGQRAVEELSGGSRIAVGAYRCAYGAVTVLGAVLPLQTVWQASDIFNALMAAPNLLALMALSGVVFRLTREYFG